MRRLLLLLPLLFAAPISAEVDPAVHKLCVDAKDYSGCVQTQLSLSEKAKSEPKTDATSNPIELTSWQKHLYENPSLKDWAEANPSLAEKKRKDWVENNDFDIHACSTKYSGEKRQDCYKKRAEWMMSPESKDYTSLIERDSDFHESLKSAANTSQCPSGKQRYTTSGFLGLGKRDLGCMTPHEIESLRRQVHANRLSILNNISGSLERQQQQQREFNRELLRIQSLNNIQQSSPRSCYTKGSANYRPFSSGTVDYSMRTNCY